MQKLIITGIFLTLILYLGLYLHGQNTNNKLEAKQFKNDDLSDFIKIDGSDMVWDVSHKNLNDSDVEWMANYIQQGGLGGHLFLYNYYFILSDNPDITEITPLLSAIQNKLSSDTLLIDLNFDNDFGLSGWDSQFSDFRLISKVDQFYLSFANIPCSSLDNVFNVIKNWQNDSYKDFKSLGLNVENSGIDSDTLSELFLAQYHLDITSGYSYNFSGNPKANTQYFQDVFLQNLRQIRNDQYKYDYRFNLEFRNFNVDLNFLRQISYVLFDSTQPVYGNVDVSQNGLNYKLVKEYFSQVDSVTGGQIQVIVD